MDGGANEVLRLKGHIPPPPPPSHTPHCTLSTTTKTTTTAAPFKVPKCPVPHSVAKLTPSPPPPQPPAINHTPASVLGH
ncbi:hypothetical protein E2C01_072795 [Portunus trituberculatus]|uniref:Uncharacterized protein n=1 Tax=Portunus trituberculatus TaxID=210409 RepID=A0A5B7HZ03_PORTR|nr:hypothetical protein [Portunus trituberculatus]